MFLFAGSSHPELHQAVAQELGMPLGEMETKRFDSGECYVRYNQSIRGKEVYLLQAIGKNPDQELMELLLMCQAATLSFAESVHVILPYFPYARQDRVAAPREPISARLVAQMLQTAGADHVITLHLHSDQVQGFFSIPVDALNARKIFADYFKQKIDKPVVVSPDVGGAKQAKKFADELGAELAILHKNRPGHHEAEIMSVVGNVQDRTCILYDDIIDTAGTLVAAKKALLAADAHPDVYAAATHGLFSGPAIQRLEEASFKEVVTTDSTPLTESFAGFTRLPIAPLLKKVIINIENKESVTTIYNT